MSDIFTFWLAEVVCFLFPFKREPNLQIKITHRKNIYSSKTTWGPLPPSMRFTKAKRVIQNSLNPN